MHRGKSYCLSLGFIGVVIWFESKVEYNKENVAYKTFHEQGGKETREYVVTSKVQCSCAERAGNETRGE